MPPLKRFLRQIPALRWCAMQHALRTRQKQSKARWNYVQSILTTIGNITISWASIELILAHLIVWHHSKHNLRPEKGWPRMKASQLNHLKQIENDGTLDKATTAKLRDIRLRIGELNDFRISVIHGVLHQRNRNSTDWHTHSVKIDGLNARIVENHYSNDQIQEKAKQISQLANEMSPFIARIIGLPHPKNSEPT